jgi:hypothetical protein
MAQPVWIGAVAVIALAPMALGHPGSADGLANLASLRQGRSMRASTAAPTADSNQDNRRAKPGETLVMFDQDGPGIINHIWLTFPESYPNWLAPDGGADPSELVLRIYWDNRLEPDVEAPAGDFFAAGFRQRAEVNSLPVVVENGVAMNCYWPMPFAKHAKITLTNESSKPLNSTYWNIDWTLYDSLPEDLAYFCAQYRQEFPCVGGRDYLILDAEGEGHYVGCVMSVRTRSPEWFGEGDEKFYIDGATKPTIWGTGTEDYFCKAWGLRKGCFPYFGVPILGDWGIGQKITLYRWHLLDPVIFHKSLRFEIEHWGWMSADETKSGKVEGFVEREDDYATVAFWYQKQPTKRFAKLPSAAERRLPEIDITFRGGDALDSAPHGTGEIQAQRGPLWPGPGQLFYNPQSEDGAWIEVPFRVEKKEIRRLVLRLTTSYDYGSYQVRIDGEKYGDVLNLYSEDTEVHEYQYGDWMFEPGKHVVRFECRGKDPRSRGHYLGVDGVCLRERRPRTKWLGG